MISATNLRTLGYMKITNTELNLDNILQLSTELRSICVRPWSFLDDYVKGNSYTALDNLVKAILPNLGDIPKQTDKRIFRDIWKNIWKSYCTAVGLDSSIEQILSDTGLALAYEFNSEKGRTLDAIEMQVYQFYTDILNWYSFTKTENIDTMEVLTLLVSNDLEQVRGYISKCC